MDSENLNSLKVTDLKQLLKSRGLSLVGVKSELVQRLESAMVQEASTTGGIVVGTTKVGVKEFDEDDILGGDDDGSVGKPDDSLLHNEDLLLSEASIGGANTIAKNPANQPKPNALVSKNLPTSTTESNVKVLEVTNPQSGVTKPAHSPSKQLEHPKNILTADQKKEMRFLKFSDPKLKNRAERFGVSTSKPVTEGDKQKQRMQRFGEAISGKAKDIEEKEKIDKRRERFGSISNEKSNNGIKPTTNAAPQIQKRQERFGVVEKSGNAKILPGFKRRRFAV